MILLCGSLFVISAENSGGTDLRPGRYTDLASLVSNQSDEYDGLQARVANLTKEVADLTNNVDDQDVKRLQQKVDALKDPAGLVPRTGPGVSITLSDAPEDVIAAVIASGSHDVNLNLVHQQDIQAVVNALWKGGATAVTIQGQRVVSTTGIKCEGNAVQLQGRPYSQPYEIAAVGDPVRLTAAIDSDAYVTTYRADAADPEIAVGWDLATEALLTAPAYDGLLDLSYAKPLR
ncbi:MAG: hypothetical protein JWM79_1106 [Nocardioides sp.]|jgi:uncharacterized protein YlxW (UPF0749 family)|nr:hypothetical protein [Nocardioides sp.]